jgi:Salmonella virulence plasmid 65kDa B protein
MDGLTAGASRRGEQEAEGRAISTDSGAGAVQPSAITLPKGGGAIRGIGQKLATNPVNGTDSLPIPLALSPGRSGFGPQVSLSYDSGAGNGPFGFGLEPQLAVGARIERWTEANTGISQWRSITRESVTTLYGFSENSRIADPADPRKVFAYLICQTFDDRGNIALFESASEDGVGVGGSQTHEENRTDSERRAQRYLKRIRDGNFQAHFADWSPRSASSAVSIMCDDPLPRVGLGSELRVVWPRLHGDTGGLVVWPDDRRRRRARSISRVDVGPGHDESERRVASARIFGARPRGQMGA